MSVLKKYNAASGLWQAVGGMGLPQTPVSFSAHKNGVDQNYGATTWAYVKLTLQSKHWDSGSCFDTTTSKFTPQVAGKYMVTANATFKTAANGTHCELMIYKNGVLHKDTVIFCTLTNGCPAPNLAAVIDMNGTTDYLEVFVRCNQASILINGASEYTFFQACLIPDSYDSTKQIVNLSATTSDYLLGVGETAKISYTNATSIPLHIAAEEGLYEVIIRNDSSMTASANNGTYLKPNATDYSNAYTRVGYYSLSTGSGGVVIATESNVYSGATGVTIKARMLISTITKSKSIEYNSIGKRIADLLNETGNIFWNDTTTVWSSLGTITFPFAQSGIIIIKRVA